MVPQTVAFLRQSPGTYEIQVVSTRDGFLFQFPRGKVFTVLRADSEPSPPRLTSATFSNDGGSVIVQFDSPTNRGQFLNSFSCRYLLESSVLTSTTRCVWVDDQSFSIFSSGSSPQLVLGDPLRLRNSTIRAKCSSLPNVIPCSHWQNSTSVVVKVSPPSQPAIPVVNIISSTLIGPCDSLSFDLSGSRGSGGRSFQTPSFEISQNSSTSLSQNETARRLISSYFSTRYSLISPFLLPSSLFHSGVRYMVIVRLCNFLGGCGEASHSFYVSDVRTIPQVSISSSALRTMKRNSALVVSGQASIALCGGETSSSNLLLSWKLDSSLPSSTLQSTSNDPRTFRLPSYSLEVGRLYSLTLTAVHSQSLSFASSTISVQVTTGSVVAVISGSSEKILSVDGSVVIDGSKSYDEDLPPTSPKSILMLSFSFSCVQLKPFYNPSCLLDLSISNSPSVATARIKETSVTNETLNSVHQVTLTVRHRLDNRTSEEKVIVKVVPSDSPKISLLSETGIKINPSQKLKLSGQITSKASGVAVWTIDDPTVSLSSKALTEVTKVLSSSTATSSMNLILPAGTLPQQSTFTFTLSATLSTGFSSSSSIIIMTNSPPNPGMFEVSPDQGGLMVETKFDFVASQWEDDDLPITYEFSYQSTSSLDIYLVIRSRMEVSFSSSSLPQGRNDEKNLLETKVTVFDRLDGKSELLQSVEVLEKKISITEIQDLVFASLNASEGNVEEMSKAISLGSSILNTANCSSSPNCERLNRLGCTTTTGTCGECLDGYLGEEGHANSQCLPLSSVGSHRRLSSTSIGQNTACKNDGDCFAGWELCGKETSRCTLLSKGCPNNCSNSGSCLFISKFNSSLSLTECNILEVNCEAQCVCEVGYAGVSCSYDTVSYSQLLETRHNLVEALDRVSQIQDVSTSSVSAALERLSSISNEHSSLSAETKMLMTSIALKYLHDAKDLGLSSEAVLSVGVILNLILDVQINGTQNQTASRSDLAMSLLQSYNDFILSDMVAGQKAVTVMNSLYRATHYSLDNQVNISALSLFPPRSELEKYLGSPVQSVNFQFLFPEGGMKVSVIESQLLDQQKNSSTLFNIPLALQFDTSPCGFIPSNCSAQITLQKFSQFDPSSRGQSKESTSLQLLNQINDTQFEVICQEGNYSTHSFMCPDGDRISFSCNGTAGVFNRLCPVLSSSLVCAALSENQLCDVLFESAENITCACSLLMNLSLVETNSQAPTDQSSVILNFGVVSRTLIHEFVGTWKSAAEMSASDVAQNLTVLFTISSVAIIGVFGLFVSSRLDHQDEKNVVSSLARKTAVDPNPISNSKRKSFLREVISKSKPRHHRQAVMKRNIIGSNEEKRIEESLPFVMRPVPLLEKCKNEVIIHHRWIGIFSYYSFEYPRPFRLLSLWMNVVIMLFIQSVTYALADPDDGSCERQATLEGCLSIKSSLSNGRQCIWNEEKDFCSFRPIQDDFDRVLIVAVLSGIISTPFSIVFQSLILFVLSAKTKTKSTEEISKGRVGRVSHRITELHQQGNSVTLSTTLLQDLALLLDKVRSYRRDLSSDKIEEFERKRLPFLFCIPNFILLMFDSGLGLNNSH
jgi:hypothetical protein